MKMCYYPWVGLDISPQGEFKPCCKYTHSIANNIKDYESSAELLQLRQDFLNGKLPAGCSRCWRDEAANLPSKRTLDNQYVFENSKPNLSSIKVLSIPFGNTCNLACRTCGSYSSSKWAKETLNIQKHFPDIPLFKHAKFYRDPEFIDAIIDRLSDVVRIDIPGGEPFYADYEIHYNFLSKLNAKNISLHYMTNVTKFPDEEMLKLLNSFGHVDVQFSIDGCTKEHFEYARWPANWGDVLINIAYWREFQEHNPNIQLSISHTVSIFNVYYLPEFLDWCMANGLPKPYLGMVSTPKFYDITILPDNAKNKITKKFENIADLKPIVSAMWAHNNSQELDNFIKAVKIVDKDRNQSFPETYPELYQLLGEQCQTLYQLY